MTLPDGKYGMTIYLYKKTHKITGLKYLGKTISKNPYTYKGSGKHWVYHIKKHGYDVETEILKECSSEKELKYWGNYYSTLWNVVESKEWANLKPENGNGGGMVAGSASAKQHSAKMMGHPNWLKCQPESAKRLIKEAQQALLSNLTPEELSARMKNSCSSPASWTPERRNKISQALTGIIRSDETRKKISKFQASKTLEQKLKCGDKNRGKTWKLIDGKRVWMNKDNVL